MGCEGGDTRFTGRVLRLVVIAAAVLGLIPAVASGSVVVTDLGPVSGAASEPLAVNDLGQVVFSNGISQNGMLITPPTPSADSGVPQTIRLQQINDSGVAVGSIYASPTASNGYTPGQTFGYWWNTQTGQTATTGLTASPSCAANVLLTDVDDQGEAIGYDETCSGSDGVYAGVFGASPPAVISSASVIYAINQGWEFLRQASNNSQVVVNRATSGQAPFPTGLYPGDNSTDGNGTASTVGGNYLGADGSIVGELHGASDPQPGIVLPGASSATSLPLPAGQTSGTAYAISSTGQIAGSDGDGAVVWPSYTSAPLSLNARLPGGSGWNLTYSLDISPKGNLVGIGTLNGVAHYFEMAVPAKVAPVVNSTGDAPATDPSSGSCDTGRSVTDASGNQVPECTLRAAIQTVNAIGTSDQTISFNIPSAALGAIKLSSALPAITATGTDVDGDSQPSGDIQILGPGADSATPSGSVGCLDVHAESVTIEGMYVGDCQVGIELEAPGHDTVTGDVIGLSTDGTTATANNYGVWVTGSPADTIGGATADDRDVISDNTRGVVIQSAASTGALVQGNWIGTDDAGSGYAPDTFGVTLYDASSATVGAAALKPAAAGTGAGNVIVASPASASATNFAVGTLGVATTASNDLVAGNLIGTDASGTSLDPAGGPTLGVAVAGLTKNDTVQNNVIAGAKGDQVVDDGTNSDTAIVTGNQIGSNRAGSHVLAAAAGGDTVRGVLVAGAPDTRVTANAITAQTVGVSLQGKAVSFPAGLTSATVPGTTDRGTTRAAVSKNVIGPLPGGKSGPAAYATQLVGVLDSSGTDDVIGPGNQLAFDKFGVGLTKTSKVTVYGNRIGTNPAGTVAMPVGFGIAIAQASRTVLGRSAHPDTIAGFVGGGVVIDRSQKTDVRYTLVGTTASGNAAIKRRAGGAPWGKIVGDTVDLPGSSDAIEVHVPTGIALISDDKDTMIGGEARRVVIGDMQGKTSTALSLSEAPAKVRDVDIGVGANGRTAVPNDGRGISVGRDTGKSVIIGAVIAHNTIGVSAGRDSKVSLAVNSIYDNREHGIQVEEPIDPPRLLEAASLPHKGKQTIGIVYDASLASDDHGFLELYVTPSCEHGGAGKKPLAGHELDGRELASRRRLHLLFIHIDDPVAIGSAITATLTSYKLGTSEFSKCAELEPSGKRDATSKTTKHA